ncbi:MAG TPA: type II toxin-antitoxin system death-on-curing family toxin [Hanamia sp.]|nr:type II toxin-antitoxin system death-on-curing family toxin [Hanamia sp.]
MITVKQSPEIHEILIGKYGGSMGVRDLNGLESALARPFQTFGGEDLYPDFFAKAAAIAESIIINHPFIDGNKRTGYVLMESILRYGSIKIIADDELLYNFMISISTGEKRFDDIVEWLKKNTQMM